MIPHDATAFYMRDNHTFKKLNIHDQDQFLQQIRKEHDKGFTAGMLCSTQRHAPAPIHNRGDIDAFLLLAKQWLEQFPVSLSKEYTTGYHGSDIKEFEGGSMTAEKNTGG